MPQSMQMMAYHTLAKMHKVIQTGKPEYIANKLGCMDLNWKEELGEELLSEFLNTALRYREQLYLLRCEYV